MHSLNHILPQDQANALDQPLPWPFAAVPEFTSYHQSMTDYKSRMEYIGMRTRWMLALISN